MYAVRKARRYPPIFIIIITSLEINGTTLPECGSACKGGR